MRVLDSLSVDDCRGVEHGDALQGSRLLSVRSISTNLRASARGL